MDDELAPAGTEPVQFCGGTPGGASLDSARCECGADPDVAVWAADGEGREIEGSEYGVCWRCLHDSLRPD